jgi:hypothetical protein
LPKPDTSRYNTFESRLEPRTFRIHTVSGSSFDLAQESQRVYGCKSLQKTSGEKVTGNTIDG